jgi:phospholipid/cholesterol/gamma-HCH transport system substrate-binding protein
MEKESINKVKLGIFLVIGLTILSLGTYFIGESKKLFSNTFRIHSVFKDINGLQVGNNVRFAGMTIGSIESINMLTDTSVQVDMVIDTDKMQFIKKDATSIIGSDGLMGNKILNINPGSMNGKIIENEDFIGTIIPVSFDKIIQQLSKTSENAALITGDLAMISGNIKNGKGTIGKLFMDSVFAENINGTIVNVKDGAESFTQNMDAAKKSIFLRGLFKKKNKVESKKKK